MGELKDLDDFYPPLDLSIFFSFLLSSSFLFLLHPQKQPQNLINEPRCRGCGTAIGDWAAAVAPSIKKEWRQLVTIGAEGFYSDSDPRASANPGGRGSWAGNEGQSFVRDHAAMDFMSIHMWPDNWKTPNSEFVKTWLAAHVADAAAAKKPLLLEGNKRKERRLSPLPLFPPLSISSLSPNTTNKHKKQTKTTPNNNNKQSTASGSSRRKERTSGPATRSTPRRSTPPSPRPRAAALSRAACSGS